MARRNGRVMFHAGAHYFGPILALMRSQQLASSFRPELVDPVVPARYLAHGVPDESVVLADQFADWVEHDTMRSLDHSVTWSDRMDEVRIPLLVMAATLDLQRPPGRCGSRWRCSAPTTCCSARPECVGACRWTTATTTWWRTRTSPAEVFPVITDWLGRHAEVLTPSR